MVVLLIHFKLVLSIIIITLSRVTLKKEEIIEQLIMNWIKLLNVIFLQI